MRDKRQLYIFIGIFVSLLLTVWGNVWFRLVTPLHLSQNIQAAFFAFFAITFLSLLARFFYFRRKDPPYFYILFTYYFMGLFVHLFFAAITKDLLLLIPPLHPYSLEMIYGFAGLAFVLNFWGIFTALSGPKIQPVQIHTKQNSSLRIAQISDLHVGPVIGKNYVKRVVEKCNAIKPDIVVLTGDIGDGEADLHIEDLAPLGELKAPLGIYYVTGNHEYYWNVDDWISQTRLRNRSAT